MLLAFHTSSSSYGLNCCEHFTFIGLQLKCIFTFFYNFYIYYYISNEYFSLEMATASLYFVEGLDWKEYNNHDTYGMFYIFLLSIFNFFFQLVNKLFPCNIETPIVLHLTSRNGPIRNVILSILSYFVMILCFIFLSIFYIIFKFILLFNSSFNVIYILILNNMKKIKL